MTYDDIFQDGFDAGAAAGKRVAFERARLLITNRIEASAELDQVPPLYVALELLRIAEADVDAAVTPR